MNLVYSSVATVWVPTEPKAERRPFLQRQDPESGMGFRVKDKEGLFLEKPDLVSKYERRKLMPASEEPSEEDNDENDNLENLTYCQFVKMFEGRGWQKINEEGEYEEIDPDANPDEGELAEGDDFNFVIDGEEDKAKRKKLPSTIMLDEPQPGEPPILRKRKFPRAIRYFNLNIEFNQFGYWTGYNCICTISHHIRSMFFFNKPPPPSGSSRRGLSATLTSSTCNS